VAYHTEEDLAASASVEEVDSYQPEHMGWQVPQVPSEVHMDLQVVEERHHMA
jgi:hypothetical protein